MPVNLIVGNDASNSLQGTAGADVIYGYNPDGPQSDASTITATRVASGLNQPAFTGARAGDPGRLFIVEKTGLIKVLDLNTGQVLATPFLSLVAVGSKLFLDSISTGSGPSLKTGGVDVNGRSVWWLDADRCRADGERLSGGLEAYRRRSVHRLGYRWQRQPDLTDRLYVGRGAAIVRDQFPSGLERRRCNRCCRHRH